MDIVQYSLKKPVSVAVAVILLITFGLIGLKTLPIQLTPDVETPKITVQTVWGGATPFEIEKEIIEKQEEALKGLQGLTKLESSSYNSFGEVTLSFELDTIVEDALLRVSNKLDEVSNYPDNADKPIIEASGANNSPIIWMVMRSMPENRENITHFLTYFEENIRQHFERIKGVGSMFVGGGVENELHVTLDMEKMARSNITVNEVINALQKANVTTSAGVLGIGRKNYRIRTLGQFQSPEDALDVVLYDDGLRKILLKDIATVGKGYDKASSTVLHNGREVIVVGLRKETGANVLEMSDRVEKEVNRLNEEVLAQKGIFIEMVYDQRSYINTAIDLVQENVLIGAALAVIVLLTFLRSVRTTVTTAIAIPISVIGTFIFLWMAGRNLNVVSLAGISFAVGMLVDNSIVVLENIDRHRKMDKTAYRAALDGAKEVWGAVFASTATTVAVFLPVIFMREEAGQLFQDIAIAITFSIILSLIVSVSVIPSLIFQLYKNSTMKEQNWLQRSFVGPIFTSAIMLISRLCLKNIFTRLVTVILFTAASIYVIDTLRPPAEYLPQGNRNLILSILVPPPGYSVEKFKLMGSEIYKAAEPHFKTDNKDGFPQLKQMFFVGADRFTLFGATSIHETRASELIPLFSRIMNSIPGIFGVSIQAGIFEQGLGQDRTVEVNISGERIDVIAGAAMKLFGAIQQKIAGAQVRPVPSIETSYPEILVIPNKKRLAANGLSEKDLGTYVDILMDGRQVDDYGPEGIQQIDLVVKGNDDAFDSPEEIMQATIVNAYGDLIKVGDVAHLKYSQSMSQINRLERKRNITLQVTPPKELPLQTAMEIIENDLITPMSQGGQLAGTEISMGGNADKLVETGKALKWNLLLALLITYLLLSALFENFLYPVIILFTVPLAAAGGFVGLTLVNTFVTLQGFDVLAMLGFIILIGTVVNNAILIVHQSLNNVRYNGLTGINAISDAVQTRIRPIFMSATTSVLAMSPLVISTGSGSELYRGLGSILLGGLAVSTLFTLFVIPALLAFVIGFENRERNLNKERKMTQSNGEKEPVHTNVNDCVTINEHGKAVKNDTLSRVTEIFLETEYETRSGRGHRSVSENKNHITEVILFRNSAHVTRRASTHVPMGTCRLQIGITAFSIERDSPRAQLFGNGEILGVGYKEISVEKPPKKDLRELEEELKGLLRQRKSLNNHLNAIEHQEQFLTSVIKFGETEVPKKLKTNWMGPEEVNAMVADLGKNFNTLYRERLTIENELEELNEKIRVVDNRVKQLKKPGSKKKKSIEILFDSKAEQEIAMEASYVAKNASWHPLYKVDSDLELTTLQMTMFAVMSQKTGESWNGVRLCVSNAEPMGDTRLPEASSWIVDLPPKPLRSAKRAAQMPGAPAEAMMAAGAVNEDEFLLSESLEEFDGAAPIAASAPPTPAPIQQAVARETPLAFEYQLPRPIDLDSGEEDNRLPLYIKSLEGIFHIYTVPAKDSRAFLVCSATPDQALLESTLHIYLGGRFVGTTHLNEKQAGEALMVNFGPDRSVKVNRKKVTDQKDETFFGKIERNTVARRIEFTVDIENLKETSTQVKLIDAIPVSRTDRLQVKGIDLQPAPGRIDYQDKKGVHSWDFTIPPGKTKTVRIRFHIKYAKHLSPYGL